MESFVVGNVVGLAICSGVCNFALVRIFGLQQTQSLVDSPKILTNTKATPPLLRLFVAIFLLDSANKRKNTESALDSAILPCLVDLKWVRRFYFWRKPKVAKTLMRFALLRI